MLISNSNLKITVNLLVTITIRRNSWFNSNSISAHVIDNLTIPSSQVKDVEEKVEESSDKRDGTQNAKCHSQPVGSDE